MRVLGVITARAGSKGVPKKNIKLLSGKPLIYYTIKAAQESKFLSKFCVSTDSEEIKNISKSYGAEVPFKRPKKISEDVDSELVVEHALNFFIKKGYKFDAVMLLQPTSPFRKGKTIDKAINLLDRNKDIDSVITAEKIDSYHPDKMFRLKNKKVIPYTSKFKNKKGEPVLTLIARQLLEDLYIPDGSIFLVKTKYFFQTNSMISDKCKVIISKGNESFDIDTELDFKIASLLKI